MDAMLLLRGTLYSKYDDINNYQGICFKNILLIIVVGSTNYGPPFYELLFPTHPCSCRRPPILLIVVLLLPGAHENKYTPKPIRLVCMSVCSIYTSKKQKNTNIFDRETKV